MNRLDSFSYRDLLPIGRVIRPHGLRGLVRIMSYSGSDEALAGGRTVYFKAVSGEMGKFTVSSAKVHKNHFLLEVAELQSIKKAEAYRGAEILAHKASFKREKDTYFWHELLGLTVYLETGDCLGRIIRIIPTKANDIYVVKQGETEVLIPAVIEVVKTVDLKNGKMTVSPVEGLLDLNEI